MSDEYSFVLHKDTRLFGEDPGPAAGCPVCVPRADSVCRCEVTALKPGPLAFAGGRPAREQAGVAGRVMLHRALCGAVAQRVPRAPAAPAAHV